MFNYKRACRNCRNWVYFDDEDETIECQKCGAKYELDWVPELRVKK